MRWPKSRCGPPAWVCLPGPSLCLFHLPSLPPPQPSSSNKLNEATTTMTTKRHDAKVKPSPSLSLSRSTLEGQLLLCVSVGLKSWQRSRIRMRTTEERGGTQGGTKSAPRSVQAQQSSLEFNQSALLILLCISFRCCLTTSRASTCYADQVPFNSRFKEQLGVILDRLCPLMSRILSSSPAWRTPRSINKGNDGATKGIRIGR